MPHARHFSQWGCSFWLTICNKNRVVEHDDVLCDPVLYLTYWCQIERGSRSSAHRNAQAAMLDKMSTVAARYFGFQMQFVYKKYRGGVYSEKFFIWNFPLALAYPFFQFVFYKKLHLDNIVSVPSCHKYSCCEKNVGADDIIRPSAWITIYL